MRVRDRACLSIGGAALLLGVLAVGGVLRWTQVTLAGLVALAFATHLLSRRHLDRISPLAAFLGIAAALTALQLVPLPSAALEVLNRTGSQIRTEGAALSHTAPWPCISLDPPATLSALVFFLILLAVALLAARYAATERGRLALLGAVAIVCGIAALVTGVHTLLNAGKLYGIYAPRDFADRPPVFGPLLNPNQLGGLMALGTVLSLGLSFHTRQNTPLRVVWIVTGLACALVCAASASRGAIVGLAIGLVVSVALTVYSRTAGSQRGGGGRLRNDVPLLIVLGLGLAAVLFASAGGVMKQLHDTSLTELNEPASKYAAWKSSLALIRESPLIGIGRGAEEVSLTRVFHGSAYFTYSHLENEYLSAIVDWGIGGALLLGVAFAWCLRVAWRRWRDGPLAAAALGALAAVMFQATVDFGLELLGLAIPVVIVASTVQLVPLREPKTSAYWLRAGRAGLVVALAALAFALATPWATSLEEDHETITDHEPGIDDLRGIAERHPMDYVAFGQLASDTFEHQNTASIAYLNHALRLHPTHLGLHRLAARHYVDHHLYAEAAIEYGLAMSADGRPFDLITEAAKVLPNADEVADAIPANYPDVDLILNSLKELQRDDIAIKWLARVARQPQHDTQIMDMLYGMAMDNKDYADAKATAELRLQTAHTTRSRLMLAQVQYQLKEYDVLLASLAGLSKWNGPTTDRAAAWLILCDVYKDKRDWDNALLCLHRLDVSGLLGLGDHQQVSRRLDEITDERTYDSKMQQVEAMKKKYGTPGAPVSAHPGHDDPGSEFLPIVTPESAGSGSADAAAKPALGIPDPFDTPKAPAPGIPNPLDTPPTN